MMIRLCCTLGWAASRKNTARALCVLMAAAWVMGCGVPAPDAVDDPYEVTAGLIIAASRQAVDPSGVETLRLVIEYPDHDYLVTAEIMRPGSIRSGAEGVYRTGFDGAVAWYQDFRPGPEGEPQELERVSEQYLADFEVDIAYYFPAYFDHPSEYVGEETLEGGDAYMLEVSLPLGAQVTYWVDKVSHLPVKVGATVTMDGETHVFERTMFDFERVDGVMYPRSFTYPGRDGAPIVGRFVSVEINTPIDEAGFAYPDG